MKTASQIVREKMEQVRKDKEAEQRRQREKAEVLAAQKDLLEQAVVDVLQDIASLPGVTVNDSTFMINGQRYTMYVQLTQGQTRSYDKEDISTWFNWAVFWGCSPCYHQDGGCSTAAHLHEAIGDFVATKLIR